MMSGPAADGEGDLHEAVRVHRTVVLVQVRTGVGQRALGEMEQALACPQRRIFGHDTPQMSPMLISC
jgi:hypothetical protein